MKILCIAHGTLSVAHQELVIAAALKQQGHDVAVTHDMDFGFFNKGVLPEPLTEEDILPHKHGDFSGLRIKEPPDIILGMDQSVAPVVAAAKKHGNRPALCMFLDFPKHVIDEGSPVDYNPEYAQRYYSWLAAGYELDNIIFNNSIACTEIKSRRNTDTELVWYPLCNLDQIKQTTKKIDLEDPYVVSCHRFVAYKGTEYLVKALYGMNIKYQAISVSGNIEKQVEADAINKLGDQFVYIKQAPEKQKLKLISNAMLLCYPQVTHWVGGLSPLEAMALKTPVVCFDFPVLRELYEDCAIYAKPKDVDDLQEKILNVLNGDFDTTILKSARNRVFKHFTPEAMAKKLTKVLEKYA